MIHQGMVINLQLFSILKTADDEPNLTGELPADRVAADQNQKKGSSCVTKSSPPSLRPRL